MDKEIKKKLSSNWFKLLQNIICDNIEKIEKSLLKLKNWKPAGNEYNFYDSYYVLNFKIRNDKLVDIF